MIGGTLITAPVVEIIEKLQRDTGAIKDINDLDDNVMVTCPVHKGGNENRPSCGILAHERKEMKNGEVVTYEKGMANCFTCGFVATLPEYVSTVLGYMDGGIEGTRWLLKNFASVEIEKRDVRINFNRGNKEEKHKMVAEEELAKYRYYHPYMYERKLTDKVIDYFDIGFDENTNCITFPVNNEKGECLFIQRRSVINKFHQNEKTPKGDTLYGIDKVYNNIDRIDKLYLCEGILDALTAWTYGGYAIALMGLVLQDRQLEILKRLPIRSIVIATDNDKHGKRAMYKIKKQLEGFKMLYTIEYPEGTKDLNDFTEEQFKNIKLKII